MLALSLGQFRECQEDSIRLFICPMFTELVTRSRHRIESGLLMHTKCSPSLFGLHR
jgi:hypothetical protein